MLAADFGSLELDLCCFPNSCRCSVGWRSEEFGGLKFVVAIRKRAFCGGPGSAAGERSSAALDAKNGMQCVLTHFYWDQHKHTGVLAV